MVDGVGLGGFASGMANGMQMGAQANRLEELRAADAERQRIEEQRQQEMAAQREEMARQSLAAQQQRQQTGGMGMPDATSMGTLKGMFGGGGGEAAGAGAGTGTATTGGTGVGMTTGAGTGAGAGAGAGSSAGSSLGGAAAAAGPWAALAAVIGINEKQARNSGARRDGTQYWKDLAGGKVVEQDFNQRIIPKVFGGYDDDKYGLAHEAGVVGEVSTLDFKNAAKKLEKGVAGTLLKKIF